MAKKQKEFILQPEFLHFVSWISLKITICVYICDYSFTSILWFNMFRSWNGKSFSDDIHVHLFAGWHYNGIDMFSTLLALCEGNPSVTSNQWIPLTKVK